MVDAPGTPTCLLLACQDHTPDRPIEENQFPADALIRAERCGFSAPGRVRGIRKAAGDFLGVWQRFGFLRRTA